MESYLNKLIIKTSANAAATKIITVENFRFTVITPMLLRVEKREKGSFCDFPTQSVIDRDFADSDYSYSLSENTICINTSHVRFCYNLSDSSMEYIILDDGRRITDYKTGNLKGTCRTLDNVNGKTSLNDGIISLNGVSVLDDSTSLVLCDDGRVIPRENKEKDVYYFAYGFNYRKAVKDLFSLTGNAPLIPKFALGNWWSRYKAYTQDEYTRLMQRFIDEKIPVTVATIDMDWHWVDVVKKFGPDALDRQDKKNFLEVVYNSVFPGWTGYSWNTELFPDHTSFLKWLKDNGFYVTMNLHPASGCKFYEDAYEDFCEFMGIDKSTRKQIAFDITDEKFIEGYFRFLHHPHENEGVDFWWIDWQQGKKTAIEGLDPLWALNHYHSLDISRDGKRPLILSRFAGAGSQRYPLGFSGDTVQTWQSLDFQPYFTSTASNIAYSWWSHDIGGHCRGYRDDELYLRWIQYGVFSPINRLHSTANEFMGKEPWMYDKFTQNCASDFLRLRHRLIPYLYSMNKLTASEGKCLIEPMYYESPKDARAYKVPNEFYFGTELIVCPITEKCNKKTGLAGTKAFLPKGRYTDIFTGLIYEGNVLTELFRDRSSIPVLAKEGAIIPLSQNSESNELSNPSYFEVLITKGNNDFVLYEDDGETLDYQNGKYCETLYKNSYVGNDILFSIDAAKGDLSLIPSKRSYKLRFLDVAESSDIEVKVNSRAKKFTKTYVNGMLTLIIEDVSADAKLTVNLINIRTRKNPDKKELLTKLMSSYKGGNDIKNVRMLPMLKNNTPLLLPKELNKAVKELDALV